MKRPKMTKGQRQIIAEKISSTIRALELLGFEYQVSNPERKKKEGNQSPRVVRVKIGKSKTLRVYNGYKGSTWATKPNGEPIANIHSIEDLYDHLSKINREPPPV